MNLNTNTQYDSQTDERLAHGLEIRKQVMVGKSDSGNTSKFGTCIVDGLDVESRAVYILVDGMQADEPP